MKKLGRHLWPDLRVVIPVRRNFLGSIISMNITFSDYFSLQLGKGVWSTYCWNDTFPLQLVQQSAEWGTSHRDLIVRNDARIAMHNFDLPQGGLGSAAVPLRISPAGSLKLQPQTGFLSWESSK